ncbi:MAG: hypothetical protein JO126_01880 [Alphaproteobacteria bacterium]|nr:hypothetical protein [Alphaproteobacteria bacterium]MBV8548187.1 hypothetical protein [Alphaproteobacteria bacterium]
MDIDWYDVQDKAKHGFGFGLGIAPAVAASVIGTSMILKSMAQALCLTI